MKKEHYIDLSDIKRQEDLEETSSFTDLMSRSERRNRKKNIDDNYKKKDINEIIKEKKENSNKDTSFDLSKTQRFINFTNEFTDNILENVQDNIKSTKTTKRYGIGNILINGILIIASLFFYIYSILFTNIQTNQTYLLIGGVIILGMITIFCISMVSGRILSKVLSILDYLVFIGYIIFNLLVVIGI